jgi:hypothetical protein
MDLPGTIIAPCDIMDTRYQSMGPSVEALKLRRMRVRNEISLSTEGEADRAEDLEALLEELRILNREIEEAEQ